MINKWTVIYKIWPPVLRTLEKVKFHKGRQEYLIGHLKDTQSVYNLKKHLTKNGFEKAILSWIDTGEILSMRKIDNKIFQYHLRVFNDTEIRGHYEYSPEAKPLFHCLEKYFEPKKEYFTKLTKKYLKLY